MGTRAEFLAGSRLRLRTLAHQCGLHRVGQLQDPDGSKSLIDLNRAAPVLQTENRDPGQRDQREDHSVVVDASGEVGGLRRIPAATKLTRRNVI